LDRTEIVVAFALASLSSGAAGLRIEGIANVAAVRRATAAPIIGIVKRDLADSPVRITPWIEDVKALAHAGADIIAFDATQRRRAVPPQTLCAEVKQRGVIAMADISSLAEARAAFAFGADVVGTTLAGYTGGPEPDEPDLALLGEAAQLERPVIAEGRLRTPAQAGEAISRGAFAVVVGSAITRPEHITRWFADAVAKGGGAS
jgi:N-acetylmannosamine-6-phosphate 2-epimerase/N-acetylmannosamine kinase